MKQIFDSIPTRIEAEQFDGKTSGGVCWDTCLDPSEPHVHTAHNNQAVAIEIGDWIVPEPNGSGYYPIKDEIFRKKYRPAELAQETLGGTVKTLHNSDISGARLNVPDIKVVGDGDLWELLCKASSENEGWMKSTKAMKVADFGCLVQVTTQQRNPGRRLRSR
jgi:hypothetical protein